MGGEFLIENLAAKKWAKYIKKQLVNVYNREQPMLFRPRLLKEKKLRESSP